MIPWVSSTMVRPISSIVPGLAEARRGCLQDLELRGPGDGLFEELCVREGDRGVRRQGRDERHVAARPGPRLTGDRRQRADDTIVVDQGRGEVAGHLEDALVALGPVGRVQPHVREGQDMPRPEHLVHPAFVAVEDRQPAGDVIGDAGPGRDLESIVVKHPDRRRVGAEHTLGLAEDGPKELLAVMRGGEASGDPEDGVETLRQLGLEPRASERDPGRVRLRDGGRPVGPAEAPEDRSAGRCARPVGRRSGRGRPRRSGHDVGPGWSRAHGPMVASATSPAESPSVTVGGMTKGTPLTHGTLRTTLRRRRGPPRPGRRIP